MKIQLKQKICLEWAVNGLGKPFGKKSHPKNRKNSKNQSGIGACEQKTTTEKSNFCSNTIFSLYFKIRAKKIHAAKPLAFSLYFLFRRDQNHHSNLTSRIMKMCEQIFLKKRQRPNTIQILWIVKKNQEKANNCPSYRCAAIKNRLTSVEYCWRMGVRCSLLGVVEPYCSQNGHCEVESLYRPQEWPQI